MILEVFFDLRFYEFMTYLGFGLLRMSVTLPERQIDLGDIVCSWKIHTSYYTHGYLPGISQRVCDHLFWTVIEIEFYHIFLEFIFLECNILFSSC